MSETKRTAADVIEFVGRGVRAQCCADAAIAGSRLALVRGALERASNSLERGELGSLELELEHARDELGELALAIAAHFERFTR